MPIRIDLRRPDAGGRRDRRARRATGRSTPSWPPTTAGSSAAAIAATRLGLPSNPPEAASRARDKLALRRALAAAGVSQPRFAELPPGGDVAAVGFPAVLKPAGLAMGRGVIRADDAEGARESERRIRKIVAAAGDDPAAPLLLEEYVPGVEVAVEALLRDGRMETLAVFDKPDPLEGPYFEETIYVTPSRLPEDAHAAVERLVASAAAAVGLREGPVHAEVRLDGPRMWAIELAARSIGGLCGRTLRFGLGVRARGAHPAPRAGASARGAAAA